MNNNTAIKVEIWSDVMCPFCYIGKRQFEKALSMHGAKDIEVEWKSFQLNPDLVTDPSRNTLDHLAQSKGWTREQAEDAVKHVSAMAESVGLKYNFQKAVVANSFNAHRLIQLAKTKDLGDAAEERLFKAYFSEGKNTADPEVLLRLGTEIGLEEKDVKKMLDSEEFSDEVQKDLDEAARLGIRGVPFFVFNRAYAVSGAQQPEVFVNTLRKVAEQ
jgi:predicted DsbA family dithiol-disulfide isomerase